MRLLSKKIQMQRLRREISCFRMERLGKHKGIIHYTVGQRKGLGLALGYPAFVLEIRPETNEVVVGSNEESMSRYVRADQVNFMTVEDLTEPKECGCEDSL